MFVNNSLELDSAMLGTAWLTLMLGQLRLTVLTSCVITVLFLYDFKLANTVGLDKFTCNFASHFIWIHTNDLFLANF
jgi:hypothetical protein